MKLYHNHPRHYLPTLIMGAALFIAFFVFLNGSLAQETAPSVETQNINPPEGIYDHDKAVAITKERGGPGGCKTEAACTVFCNGNQETCMTWAKDNGVMSTDKFDKYIGFAKEGGPGGCKTPDSCKSYCEDRSHFDSCLDSGEKLGIISPEQANQARKTGPGGCKTSQECNTFCENPQNQDVCIDSAVEEGFMTAEEAQKVREFKSRAQEFQNKVEGFKKRAEEYKGPEIKIDPGFDEEKAKELIKTQGGPGGCKTFEECQTFCDNSSNQEACFAFAEKHDLFKNKDQAEKIKKISKEGGPGGCKGEKECKQFCENEANFETCIGFAEKEGFLAPEEVEKAKKGIQALKEGGPLGCKTKETCETVCQDQANQDACFDWGRKNGLISEEDAKFMEEAKKFREELEKKRFEFEGKGLPGGSGGPGFQGQQGQFQGQPGNRQGEFPGPSQFPGRQGEFPGKPPSGEFPPGQMPPGFEGGGPSQGFHPPEGFRPPEGFNPQQTPVGQFPQGFQPPAGLQQPPSGTFIPPPGELIPPPTSPTPPPPPPPTPPSSLLQYSPFGAIFNFFFGR